jgi:hypothetical protein
MILSMAPKNLDDKKMPIMIGRAEKVYLLDYLKNPVAAKVDTGADLSSIWATNITENEGLLTFTLFGRGAPGYTGEVITLRKGEYSTTRVSSSFGHREYRFMVKLRIKLAGRVVRATFTLADRSSKTYPILLGRRLLHGKFLVDVSQGQPLRKEEKTKLNNMRLELNQASDKLGEKA